jgi:hypothetical protein
MAARVGNIREVEIVTGWREDASKRRRVATTPSVGTAATSDHKNHKRKDQKGSGLKRNVSE